MIRGRLLTPVLIVFWLCGAVSAGLGQQATAPARWQQDQGAVRKAVAPVLCGETRLSVALALV